MKKVLKGKHFANVEEMKQHITEAPKKASKLTSSKTFEKWKKCLDTCITSNEEDFVGD